MHLSDYLTDLKLHRTKYISSRIAYKIGCEKGMVSRITLDYNIYEEEEESIIK